MRHPLDPHLDPLRIYLLAGVTLSASGIAALTYVYGWTPLLVLAGATVMIVVGVGGWMHRYPGSDE